jgi:hypothetical protein
MLRNIPQELIPPRFEFKPDANRIRKDVCLCTDLNPYLKSRNDGHTSQLNCAAPLNLIIVLV